MEAKAVAKYVRIAPRKERLIVDMIRGKSVEEALGILRFSNRVAAARVVEKTLLSAMSNAENKSMDVDRAFVSRAFVDQGPTIKRFRPRAMGRASPIQKKTSMVTIILEEKN